MDSITIRSPLDYQNAVVELIKRRAARPNVIDHDVQALIEAIEHYECVTVLSGSLHRHRTESNLLLARSMPRQTWGPHPPPDWR
jgi:hypothetical protein